MMIINRHHFTGPRVHLAVRLTLRLAGSSDERQAAAAHSSFTRIAARMVADHVLVAHRGGGYSVAPRGKRLMFRMGLPAEYYLPDDHAVGVRLPTRWQRCPRCNGRGVGTIARNIFQACVRCKGKGRIGGAA